MTFCLINWKSSSVLLADETEGEPLNLTSVLPSFTHLSKSTTKEATNDDTDDAFKTDATHHDACYKGFLKTSCKFCFLQNK